MWVVATDDRQIIVEATIAGKVVARERRYKLLLEVGAVEEHDRIAEQRAGVDLRRTVGAGALRPGEHGIAGEEIGVDRELLPIREQRHARERDDQRREILGDGRRGAADHHAAFDVRGCGGILEALAQACERLGPVDRAEALHLGVVLCQVEPPVLVYLDQIDIADQLRVGRRGEPVVVAACVILPGLIAHGSRIHLEAQVDPGQLAVEVFAEACRACAQACAHTLELAHADLPHPVVLQRGQQHQQQQRRDRDRHREDFVLPYP